MSQLSPKKILPLIVSLLFFNGCSQQAVGPEPERAVRTLVVKTEATGLSREYAAEIRARIESRLSFRVPGKLLERKVNLGDQVKAGQLLARLDAQDLLLAQAAAQAGLQAATINRDLLRADYKRYVELREQGFISAAELDRRDVALKAAQAQLDQAQAQASAQGNLTSYARLLADVAGLVTGVDAEPGMVVPAGASILRVAQDGSRDVVFSVPEDQLPVLRAAANRPEGLQIKLWSDPPAQAARTVTLREVSAAADPVTRTFLVKADAGRNDVKLGQSATVILRLQSVDSLIKLPLTALMQQKGQTMVWLLDSASMTVKQQVVQVGAAAGNEVVIAAGLLPGQELVVAGVHTLTSGQKVKRYQVSAAAAAN